MKTLALLFCFVFTLMHAENKFYAAIGKKADGYYSQYGQDKYLDEHYFRGKKDGVFVDIGAHNGVALSNTKYFEERGWTGICIEPIPETFQELRRNRSAVCIQGCISDKPGKAQFLRIDGYSEMLSGLVDKYHPQHLDRVRQELSMPQYEGSAAVIDVDCFLLNDLLEQHALYHIDYLSLDTEGGELDILKAIDFSTFVIDVIDVENNYQDQELVDFLVSKGYRLIAHIGCDDIFVHSF